MTKKRDITKTYTFEELEPRHQRAIELRLKNMAYHDISKDKLIDVAPETVRGWFAKGGICVHAYQVERKQRILDMKERMRDFENKIEALTPDALIVLEQKMRSGNLKAAQDILDRAGYIAVQKVEDVTESEGVKLLKALMKHDEKQLKNKGDRKGIQGK